MIVVKDALVSQTVRLYIREAWRHPFLLLGSFLFSGLWVLVEDVILPLLMARLVDIVVQPNANFGAAYHVVWLIVWTGVASFILARITFLFRNPMQSLTLQGLSTRVFEAYERQEYGFFANSFVGALVARATRFTNTFKEAYDQSLFVGMVILVQLFVPMVILADRALILGVIFLLAALVMATATIGLSKFKLKPMRDSAAAESRVTAALADVLTNNLAVKLFARRRFEEDRFHQETEVRRRLFNYQMKIGERVRAARSVTLVMFQIVIAITLVKLTESNAISIGTILLAQVYLTKLGANLWQLNRVVERMEEALADSAEMTEIMLRESPIKDPADPKKFTSAEGVVELREINFHYDDGDQQEALFKNFQLQIPAGQKVGLVGPSGGGKSTLTKLLLRFMDIQDGAIVIDGRDIREVTQDSLREHIAYVPQEPVLFHRSIRENILYGNPKASEDMVIKAAKMAHAHDFIKQLPKGYDTLVGERGVKLSGGEKQRVAIARAMLKSSPILILDEATSALDSKSEKAIVAALDNLIRNRTTIVIAHRLSTIRKLDRILVLDDGKIVEDGPHEQLLKNKGMYAELWHHQSGAFLAE